MFKSMGSALALGLATAAVLVTAAPGGAQSGEEPPLNVLEATLAPAEAAAGDPVTVDSVEACATADRADLAWAVFRADTFAWENGASWHRDDAVVWGRTFQGAEGWSVTFSAPAASEGGPIEQTDAPPGSPLDVYGPLGFRVGRTDFVFVAKCTYSSFESGATTVTPNPVEAGETVTATPDGPCPMPATRGGDVAWTLVGPAGSDQQDVDSGLIPLPTDGTWSLALEAPPDPGLYGIFGSEGAISGIDCMSPEGGRTHFFAFALFNVTESDEPPTSTTTSTSTTTTRPTTPTTRPRPPTPRPPVPIPKPPPYTG